MPVWRPRKAIRVVAIGLHWRDGRLLAAEVHGDDGSLLGVRPLGGAADFAEGWQQALRREFREELGIDVTLTGPPRVIENTFQHEGATGHEIVFACDVLFPSGAFAGQEEIVFHEDDGSRGIARWFALDELDRESGGPALFPAGLKALLAKG